MEIAIDYWFTIEPYIFVSITNKCVLLYNTLDGVSIKSNKKEVIELLRETLLIENCGVILLTHERYMQKHINKFIHELRKKYMCDIIDVSLSKGKPVQLLPYFNFPNKIDIYKKHNFSSQKNVLKNLFEISINIDSTTNIEKLIPFLQSIPNSPTFNIIGNIREVKNYNKLLLFFEQHPSPKNLFCSYTNAITLQPDYENNFSVKILSQFPIDMRQFKKTRQILQNQTLPIEYIFDVASDEDCFLAEQIIEQFQIKKHRLNPIYTGNNILFFEKNVFLSEENILSESITIKDLFSRQVINIYNFGKIIIMPNGDTYANLNHPILGNIYSHNIYEIVSNEMETGKSWFHIRNQEPCNKCIYQWLCPPPSNYEITIGRPNLCHVKNNN